MRLCFGTFAGLLNRCRKKSINQTFFVGRMAWVIDKKTSCLRIFSRDDDKKEIENSITAKEVMMGEVEGNSPVVSNLLTCKRNYENHSRERPKLEDAKKDFSEMVSPMIVDRHKPSIILALLDLIRYDDSINSERSECFERCFGISKGQLFYSSEFEFTDIMTKALLYVTSPEIENSHPNGFSAWTISEDDKDIPDMVDPKELVSCLIRNAENQTWYSPYWNATTESLRLVDRKSEILADQMYTLAKRGTELFEKKVIEDFHFDSDMYNINKMIKARLNIEKVEYRGEGYLTIEKMRECLNDYKKLLGELADYVQEFMRLQNVMLNAFPTTPDRRMTQMYEKIENVYREIDKQLMEL